VFEAVHVGVGEDGDLVDFNVGHLFVLSLIRNDIFEVGLREEELLIAIEDKVTHELGQVGNEYTSIVIIGHTATIHSVTNQISQSGPWQFFLFSFDCFIQVKRDQIPRNSKVRIIEIIRNIPTNLSELLSLLNSRVEETQHINHRLVLLFWTLIQIVLRQL
jgi:hypothetical protein